MKSKILKFLSTISYYPRLLLDKILFLFVNNDYSILDKFVNKDCLIVGNGPSLNQTELERIDMPSIGMNKINMLFDRSTWRPDLIVCVNGLVIQQNAEFFNTTEIPLVLPIKAWYLGIKKRPNVIFIKISDSHIFKNNFKNSFGIGSTVTYTCLQIAAALNVKTANIVGVDHSFKLDQKSTKKEHNIEMLKGNDQNHFDPNYFKDKLWGLPDLEGSEMAYTIAKEYFMANKITVTDYTVNGKLDVFKKGDVNEIYK